MSLAVQKWNPKKVHWWYERLADWMIANPHRPLKDAAGELGCTVSYVYQLKNTDTFEAYWAARSNQHSDAICVPIAEKAKATAEQALDILSRKLTTVGEAASGEFLLDTADKLMKRLGYAATKNQPPTQVNVGVTLISAEELQRAKDKMYQRRNPEANSQSGVAEAEVIEPSKSDVIGSTIDPEIRSLMDLD